MNAMNMTTSAPEYNVPACFSIRSSVSPSQLQRAAEYATLWSCTPDGARRLEQQAAESNQDNNGGVRRVPSSSSRLLFTSAQYHMYAEVLDTLLSHAVSNPTRLGSRWSLEVLQERFGFTQGSALYHLWLQEPRQYVENVVSCIAKAIQQQFVLPYCCSSPSFSLDDFDIHIQWRPRNLTSTSQRFQSTKNKANGMDPHPQLFLQSGGVVAVVTIRYTPQVAAREEALRLVELSMSSTKAAGQSLQSSLVFWDLVRAEQRKEDVKSLPPKASSSTLDRSRKRIREDDLDGSASQHSPQEGNSNVQEEEEEVCSGTATIEASAFSQLQKEDDATAAHHGFLNDSSSSADLESLWKSLQRRVAAMPVLEPPLTRRVRRETLYSSEDDEEEDHDDEGEMTLSPGQRSGRHGDNSREPFVRVPVVTSLPADCETICTITPLTNQVQTEIARNATTTTSSATRFGVSTTRKARAIWRRIRRGGIWSAGPGSTTTAEEDEGSESDKEESHLFTVPTILGSWRSLQHSEQRKLALNGGAALTTEDAGDEDPLKNETADPQAGHLSVSTGAMQLLLSKQRRRWEQAVLLGSIGSGRSPFYSPPVCAQPDELNLHNTPSVVIAKTLSSAASHRQNVSIRKGTKFPKSQGITTIQWGVMPSSSLPSSPSHSGSHNSTRSNSSTVGPVGGAVAAAQRSRCGLVAQLSISVNGMVYVGFPGPFCTNTLYRASSSLDNAYRTGSTVAPQQSSCAPPSMPAPPLPDVRETPSKRSAPKLVLPLSYLQLEDSKSFTRGILGLS